MLSPSCLHCVLLTNHSSYELEFKGIYYYVMKLPMLLQLIECNFYINFPKGRWNFLSEDNNLFSETVQKYLPI